MNEVLTKLAELEAKLDRILSILESEKPQSVLPAYERIGDVLSNPKSSPQEIGQTMAMLKNMKALPRHVQALMNNPNVPVHLAVQALRYHAEANPEQAQTILAPVLVRGSRESPKLLESRYSAIDEAAAIYTICLMPNDEAALPMFQKPPVSEVAVGVQFPTVLTPVHLGLYYQRIKARFPKYQVLPPVPPAFEIFGAASITPIVSFGVQMPSGLQPRMWFLSQDENSLIQLQSDRLIFNWRGGLRGSPYPHFDAVYEEFVKAFDELGELAETEGIAGIVVNQCEVTYVNPLATANTGVPLSEPERIFRIWTDNRGAEWRQPLEDLSFTARYPLADEGSKPFGRLTVTLSSYGPGPLYSMAPQISPGFQLEMTARGIPKGTGRDGVAAFHDHAHRAIVRCFAAITTPTMHELWERYQ